MKPSTLLKKAKRLLAKNHGEYIALNKARYICWAIDDVATKHYAKNTDHTDIVVCVMIVKDHINKLLGVTNSHGSLEQWLRHHHCIYVDYSIRENMNKIQRTRHAWIDNMIQYFEARGE